MADKTAFVTGASRRIGKAIASELAAAGYDVAITARTVQEGDAHEHSSTLKRSDTSPLPGSLDATADLIRSAGQQCLTVPGDLLDHPSLVSAADAAFAEWGHLDVLVNNGRYVGPGHMDFILDTPVRVLRDHLEANALAPVVLIKTVVPRMGAAPEPSSTSRPAPGTETACRRRSGRLGARLRPQQGRHAPHRRHSRSGDRGFRSLVQCAPGFIATERIAQDMAGFGFERPRRAASVVGKVCVWLMESPDAAQRNGQNIEAQELCSELNLLPVGRSPGSRGCPGCQVVVDDVECARST
jgi:NAD(P)-dependent dehydrogenase (short-subunit alcohol dehydrogenase family)